MEYEKSKQKYLDKLKKTSSKGLYKSTGVIVSLFLNHYFVISTYHVQ